VFYRLLEQCLTTRPLKESDIVMSLRGPAWESGAGQRRSPDEQGTEEDPVLEMLQEADGQIGFVSAIARKRSPTGTD
jgi:hypothetical protein